MENPPFRITAIDLAPHADRPHRDSREAMRYLRDQVRHVVTIQVGKKAEPNPVGAYMGVYHEHEHRLGHYFRHLYHIIKFVKKSDITDKRTYTNFVSCTAF